MGGRAHESKQILSKDPCPEMNRWPCNVRYLRDILACLREMLSTLSDEIKGKEFLAEIIYTINLCF